MPGWVAVVVLLLSNVATHALARALVPEAAKPWTTPNLLTWVAWLVVVAPGVLVGWSRLDDALTRQKLRRHLDEWLRERGPVGPLALSLVEAQQAGLLQELAAALEPRRAAEPPVAAFLEATAAYLAAAGYGSGAFNADGWASLGLTERWDRAKQAAAALT